MRQKPSAAAFIFQRNRDLNSNVWQRAMGVHPRTAAERTRLSQQHAKCLRKLCRVAPSTATRVLLEELGEAATSLATFRCTILHTSGELTVRRFVSRLYV